MKHNALTALSLAAALVVAGSAGATPFSVTFDEAGYAIDAAHAWDTPSQDAATIVTTNGIDNSSTKALLLDTGNDELSYTNDFSGVQVLTMDVCFVAADTDPDTSLFDGKTMVYLNETNNTLRAFTDASGWKTLTGSFSADTWYQLKMEFSGTKVVYSVNGTPVGTNDLAASFSSIQSVGFKGTGLVDNFAGAAAGLPSHTTDGSDTGDAANAATVAANGDVVGNFAAKIEGDDLKFIRVYNANDEYVTLRYVDSQRIALPPGFTPSYVTAYYGDDVSAVPNNMTVAAESVSVDTTGAQPAIKVEIDGLVSGVYYKVVDADSGTTLDSKLVAPAEEGGETVFSFAPDSTAWGVKKFKVVVADEL